jgi:hypothetical protein
MLVIVGAVLALVAAASPATAGTSSTSTSTSTAGPTICLPVRLTGTGDGLPDDGSGSIRTEALISFARVPVATTIATFTPQPSPVGGPLSFIGPIVFTPRAGTSTFTAQVQGTVDLDSGKFRAQSTSITGTGVLAGISGSLTFAGTQDLASGKFTESIRGSLCSRVRPW